MHELNKQFNNKYNFLKPFEIEYDKTQSLCIVTFLYPYDVEDITNQQHVEIEKYLERLFLINGGVKVKFRKSYLDEKLIVSAILEYIESDKKSIVPYLNENDIHSSYNGRTVHVVISLNKDVLKILDKLELEKGIKEYLNNNFIAYFDIDINSNDEIISSKIDFADIPAQKAKRRYKVTIDEEIIGKDITPVPQYIKDIKEAFKKNTSSDANFDSIILSGAISGLTRKTYKAKKGKHIGEDKPYYTFVLTDSEESIDCVMFCSISADKKIENIEDLSMVVCKGDIKKGLSDKITYYIKNMAFASPYKEEIKEDAIEDEIEYNFVEKFIEPEKKKVKEEKQINLFDVGNDSERNDGPVTYTDLINKNKIVVFDIETTGLDFEKCEITEIGAVKIEYGKVTEKFSSFVKTNEPIPLEVQNLTHITNEMIADAPNIDVVINKFYEWCKGCVLCGHNAIGFDIKFIKKAGEKVNLNFDNDIVDTMLIARQSSLKLKNYKLGTIVDALGLTLEGAHRAYNDAYATAQVLLELSKI